MKKLLLGLGLAVAFASSVFASPLPTTIHSITTCAPNPEMNIDALVPALEKVKDQMPAGMHVEFIDGDALVTWDKNIQEQGGPALPENIKALAFLLVPGWDDSGANVVQMLAFDKDGCFIGGKAVPAAFVMKGLGRNV
jgi:hypothetical protein